MKDAYTIAIFAVPILLAASVFGAMLILGANARRAERRELAEHDNREIDT